MINVDIDIGGAFGTGSTSAFKIFFAGNSSETGKTTISGGTSSSTGNTELSGGDSTKYVFSL